MQGKNQKNFADNDNFGQRVRKLRIEKGLSQEKFASLIGYKRSGSVSNIENNKTPPDIKTLTKIAKCLNADLHWLITGEPSPSIKLLSAAAENYLRELGEKIKQLESESISLDLAARFRGEENEEAVAQNEQKLSALNDEYKAIVQVLKMG